MANARWLLTVSVLTLAMVGGCADSNPGITIEGVIAPSGCEYRVTTPPTFLIEPMFDTSLNTLGMTVDGDGVAMDGIGEPLRPHGMSYTAVLQVASRILSGRNYTYPLMADPNVFNVQEAEIELRNFDGTPLALADLPARFRVPVSGTVYPSPGVEVEYAVIPVPVIPAIYGEALGTTTAANSRIVVAVRLRGTTTGGSAQETGEYSFYLNLCHECLYVCRLEEDGTPVTPALSCFPGQDIESFVCLRPRT